MTPVDFLVILVLFDSLVVSDQCDRTRFRPLLLDACHPGLESRDFNGAPWAFGRLEMREGLNDQGFYCMGMGINHLG